MRASYQKYLWKQDLTKTCGRIRSHRKKQFFKNNILNEGIAVVAVVLLYDISWLDPLIIWNTKVGIQLSVKINTNETVAANQ